MCGIVGAITREGSGPRDLTDALTLMFHRGPDGCGQWGEAYSERHAVAIGHRRLSIIDLSDAASQPMVDVSGRYWLTFNGEIYNYIELRNELKAMGARFRTASDSEVILEAYKVWGTDCVTRFNGMYGFAIWDTSARRLFAARDRFGEKPFLFVAKPELFAFASEYKALLTMPGVSRAHDDFRLLRFATNPSTGLDGEGRQSSTIFISFCRAKRWRSVSTKTSRASGAITRRDSTPRALKSPTRIFSPSFANSSLTASACGCAATSKSAPVSQAAWIRAPLSASPAAYSAMTPPTILSPAIFRARTQTKLISPGSSSNRKVSKIISWSRLSTAS
ncbi:Asparagine synthase (Glutamine-hydrolyzing) [Methylocystis sp. SC2]|nr:Asparagine synthase (Glutamine-hydrolyzing) [Methylocystis sp. SC2]